MTDHLNDWIVIPQILEHPWKKAISCFHAVNVMMQSLLRQKSSCSHGIRPVQRKWCMAIL